MFELQDVKRFETSDRFEGTDFRFDTDKINRTVFAGWRFTCAKWPSPIEVQQQVELHIGYRVPVTIVLSSILSIADIRVNTPASGVLRVGYDRHLTAEKLPDLLVCQQELVVVRLLERPVEGAGLRLHLRGFGVPPRG